MSSPAPDPHPSPRAEDILIEWLARRDSPEPLGFEDLCRAHPDLAPELQQLHSEWQRIDSLMRKAGLGVASSLDESLARRLAEEFGSGLDPQVSLHAEEEASSGPPTSQLFERLREHTLKTSRYKLHGEIARGGMGAILKVWDEDLRRNLAMKVILGKAESSTEGKTPPVDKRLLARFLEEAQVTGQLDHPGIVPVHELGLDADGRVYFTMKLVKGRDLKQVFELTFEEQEGWNETRTLGVLLKVCEAMAFAHSKGVIHRDLKPANVMVGSFGEVYVMDWGLARVVGRKDAHDLRLQGAGTQLSSVKTERRAERAEAPDSPLVTMDGDVVGTPAYMPLEQALGQLERLAAHSDVYAIGAMLYHLLARHMPYVPKDGRVTNRTVLALVVQGPPAPLATIRKDIPAELVAIVEHAMAREPERRYRDTLELAEDLRAYLEHRVVKAYETGALAELRKWVERNKALAASAAAAVLLLIAGLTTSLVFKARADRNATLARENAEEAGKQATIARASEERALASETIAKDEKERAEKRADEVLRLSALQKLEDLTTEADRLWPAHPQNIERYEAWLTRAEALMAELKDHEAKLADLRKKARPWTAEEAADFRALHPRAKDMERLQRELDFRKWRSAVLASGEPGPEPTASEVGLDFAGLPADANGLKELAWPLVDPERKEFGGEAKGLLLARRAVELAGEEERAAIRDTLAWGLFALARFDEAVAEEEQALEEAGPDQQKDFEGYVAKLRAAIEAELGPEAAEEEEKRVAELEGELTAIEGALSTRPEWTFDDDQDKWWHNQLEKLVNGLTAFADAKTGLFSEGTSEEHGWGMKKRLASALLLRAGFAPEGEQAKAWSAALPEIRVAYPELALTPQVGLVPLGPDPASGLWEFAHLETGEPAVRGADGKLILKEETGLVFVLLPGGTFQMGAQKGDPNGENYDPQAAGDEGPVHAVTLRAFFLSKYEMTQGQWAWFVGRNPSYIEPGSTWGGKKTTLVHPVEQVNWLECRDVMDRLGLALPSEAQWEFGARGGTSTVWWTGNERDSLVGAVNLADAAAQRGGQTWSDIKDWPELDDGYTVHAPVNAFLPNAFGLHNVHGNVWEWCLDGYDGDFYTQGPAKDPVFPPEGSSNRVFRGGSFVHAAVRARSAYRVGNAPSIAGYNLGLRPARTIAP